MFKTEKKTQITTAPVTIMKKSLKIVRRWG